jgi:hypothetical protein
MTFLFNGLACVCVAIVLWLRSPMRMPVGERAFRAFWLGGPGRWLIRWTMRRAGRDKGATGPARTTEPSARSALREGGSRSGTPAANAVSHPPIAEGRLDVLEARVQALEAWRNGTQP